MSLNALAEIVPLSISNAVLDRASDDNAITPDSYNRVQLLSESAIHDLVFKNHDRSFMVYGFLSPDFPLCLDFANMCALDVLRGALKAGLAVRPCFGVLIYTQNEIDPKTFQNKRHAINFTVTSDKRILFYEPQADKWLDAPRDCKSMDEFRL